MEEEGYRLLQWRSGIPSTTPAAQAGIMYGNMIFDQFLRGLNWPLGSLMSLAMLVLILVPLFLIGRFVRLSDLAGI